MGISVFEEWRIWLAENWMWFLPVLATFTSPLIASGMSILYDYFKMRGWVR